MQNGIRGVALIFLLLLTGIAILIPMLPPPRTNERPYSQFLADVEAHAITTASISGEILIAGNQDGERYLVRLPASAPGLEAMLLANGVEVEYAKATDTSVGTSLLTWLLPLMLVVALVWLAGGKEAGQAFSFGESRAREYLPTLKRVTMADVAGMPEVKEEMAEVIDFLRSPDRYLELGARIPKGVLLWGPPGTGKTLLARAVAGDAGVAFLATSGSEFVEMFAGVGAARVRDLFAKARKQAPCVVFIDEIDAVGRSRASGPSGGSDERDQTLNQLLVEMDGFNTGEGLIVMAATNRVDTLDPALLRPGRFDRQIAVDLPDRRGRREILGVHAQEKPLAADVDLDQIASMTPGFAGADLANLLNEAALLAARWRRSAISMEEVGAAYERISAGGPARRRTMSASERWRIAVHEAGHAIVAHCLNRTEAIARISIIPRGKALGYVLYRPREDKGLFARSELLDRMATLLGGRAAEIMLLGEAGTGPADDLEQATRLARRMVTELGMSRELGPVVLAEGGAEQTAAAVDGAIRQLVLEAEGRAAAQVFAHRDALERVARALLERESLEGAELEPLLYPEAAVSQAVASKDVDTSTGSVL